MTIDDKTFDQSIKDKRKRRHMSYNTQYHTVLDGNNHVFRFLPRKHELIDQSVNKDGTVSVKKRKVLISKKEAQGLVNVYNRQHGTRCRLFRCPLKSQLNYGGKVI